MFSPRLITTLLCTLTLTACGGYAPRNMPTTRIPLSIDDLTPAADPALPELSDALAPPAATGAAERAYLWSEVIEPLMIFSLAQEAALAAERRRAAGIIEKAEAVNRPTRRPWWRFWR